MAAERGAKNIHPVCGGALFSIPWSEAKMTIETDVLIVGAGPSGAGASALLASYGVSNIVVNKRSRMAQEPRAHITNQRAVEVFRDLGLEGEVKRFASPRRDLENLIFCDNVAGKEFGRLYAWQNGATSEVGHKLASPTETCDLTQDFWEPILLNAASGRGSSVRFETEYLGLEQDADGVTVSLRDLLTKTDYQVRAKYVIGADGARSKVVADLGLPVVGRMGIAGALNITFDADLAPLVAHRPAGLFWMMWPTKGMGQSTLRMVRPWDKWMAICGVDLSGDPDLPSEEECMTLVRDLIGRDDIPVTLTGKSYWAVSNAHASTIMKGRVFCMGDAIHRHPPTGGLGANTCIQDAYNLAWKLAAVLRGEAAPSLLDTYQDERAPVARDMVDRANRTIPELLEVYAALDALPGVPAEAVAAAAKLYTSPTADGERLRTKVRNAMDGSRANIDAHGFEVNHRYVSSAVVPDGTPEPAFTRNPEFFYQSSSRPGAHLPHAWLADDQGRRVAVFDLCGKGRFTLITGLAGGAWVSAAAAAAASLGIELRVHVIGPGQKYMDPYGEWRAVSEVGETGALVVRPDHYISFRAADAVDAEKRLIDSLKLVLGRNA
jgi:2,4-dichlorophenol 6-monooxygenase